MKSKWGVARTTLGFVLAYAVLFGANFFHLGFLVYGFILAHQLGGTWESALAIARISELVGTVVNSTYIGTLLVASLSVALGGLVRMIARARLRAGLSDPIEGVRRFVGRHPRMTTAMTSIPIALWAWAMAQHGVRWGGSAWDTIIAALALPIGVGAMTQLFLARRGVRALVAPTLGETTEADTKAEGFTFNAVAVTRQTIGLVVGHAAFSLLMLSLAYALPTSTLVRHPAFSAAMLSYFVLTAAGTFLFRRASKIKVGFDGIYVSGSTRAKFVAFADIDTARASGVSIELVRGKKVVMRFQLHGEDAMRRDALAERIRDAIAVAAAQRHEPAVGFVKSATPEALERAAGGAASYREAAPTREKLWEVLESPAMDAAGRSAAAAALAREVTPAERTRLRVAAEACAEPTVRARIHELLEEDEEHDAPIPAKRALSRG